MKRWLTLIAVLALASVAAADERDDRTTELERKVDALTREIEGMRLGAVAETARVVPRLGLGPAAGKVYGSGRGVSIGGYGEMLLEKFDRTRQDGTLSGQPASMDFLRSVLYVGYRFSDDLVLDSEIELEHAGVRDEAAVEGEADLGTGAVEGEAELSGEVSLEFAYLDWRFNPSLGARAGMLLVPVGLTNEMHEPPTFFGARRPDVETRIIPTTWSANGVGLYGDVGGRVAWRAYVMEGLNAEGFSAESAIRGGRQSGSQSLATHPAFVVRADFTTMEGLVVGGSIFTGDAWQEAQPAGSRLNPRVTLSDVHGRLEWHGLDARALYAKGTLDQAVELSDALGLVGGERLGENFFGGYVEAGYDVLPLVRPGTRYALAPYARYEEWDTQDGVVAPGAEDASHHHTELTLGAAFRPHPAVVIKLDRQTRRNETDTETDQWNAAIGYLF